MSTRISREKLEAALPKIEGELEVMGAEGPIRIHRDAWGIPHVEATTPADAFFGQGFAAAADRLFQMDSDRLRAAGRWAEMMGEDGVESDIMMRKMGLARSARRDFPLLKASTRGMLRAYSAGVNAYLRNADSLPVEYELTGTEPEPWKPWHSLSVFLVRHVAMGSREMKTFRAQLVTLLGPDRAAALFPGYAPGHPLILPPGEAYEPERIGEALAAFRRAVDDLHWLGDGSDGSNNWVISGERTDSGLPLLAGDPHRMLEVPNTYWQNHLYCPEMETIGLSFPGVPGFPHFGHNDRVAWCITHTGADTQDLFVERFSDGQYLYRGEWLRPEGRWEKIRVRGREDDLEVQVIETRNGAIVAGDTEDGYGLSFRWTATHEPNTTMNCLVPMMGADSAEALEEAVRGWVDPCNNLLFADVEGDFGYRVRGRLPVRSPRAGWVPLPGWTGEGDWEGYVPFEEMPADRDPENGVFATANNRVVGDEFPHYIAVDFAPGYRAMRLFEMLGERERFAIEDMPSLHSDIVSLAARELCPSLAGVEPDDDRVRWARDLLLDWDGVVRAGAIEPTIYSTFREILMDEVLRGLLGDRAGEILEGPTAARLMMRLRGAVADAITRNDATLLPGESDWSPALARSLERAVFVLKENLGTEESEWHWGNVHRAIPRHPLGMQFPDASHLLDPPDFPMGGDSDTVQAAAYLPGSGFSVVGTAVARYAFDLSDWNRSGWIVPLGGSGHPGSRHYTDQAGSWSDHRLIPMLYDWEEIAGGCEGILTLQPRE